MKEKGRIEIVIKVNGKHWDGWVFDYASAKQWRWLDSYVYDALSRTTDLFKLAAEQNWNLLHKKRRLVPPAPEPK